ncbi:MAG: DUF4345 domain-containing protein [Myxococcales bacterium]|nr:DUF4345 domain-containing protein [Myxococcales bacterium]
MSAYPRILLAVAGLSFAGLGVAFLIWPTEMVANVDIHATSALARNDIRAVYGGLEVALGVTLLGAREPVAQGLAIRLLALLFCGLVLSRVLSIVVDGAPADPGALLLALELSGLAATAVAFRKLR